MSMRSFFGLLSGIVFGVGLLLGGMVDPLKVKAFLDVFGRWDPSLAMVILGAVSVSAAAFGIARWRGVSYGGRPLHLPPNGRLDWRLFAGAALFGTGWGLIGLCPAPAIVAASTGYAAAAAFVPAMLVGIVVYDQIASGFEDVL